MMRETRTDVYISSITEAPAVCDAGNAKSQDKETVVCRFPSGLFYFPEEGILGKAAEYRRKSTLTFLNSALRMNLVPPDWCLFASWNAFPHLIKTIFESLLRLHCFFDSRVTQVQTDCCVVVAVSCEIPPSHNR